MTPKTTQNIVLLSFVSVRGVTFHTTDKGRITIADLNRKGKIQTRQQGGPIELLERNAQQR